MLSDIIDSKHNSAVLSFFLAAPQRSFSILELSKRLNISHMKSAHALGKLTSMGILKVFSKKNKKYYLLNSRYKLLPDLRLSFARSGIVYHDELFSAVKKVGDIKAAFLSGIFCGQPNLPVDLLLVGKANLNKLANFLKSVEKLMGQDINYSIMTVEEFLLRRDTFDKFIKDIFDYPHLVVLDEVKNKKRKSSKK